jgi:hypothetical protein
MARKMTWDEMKNEFPDEWVLIINYELDNSGHIKSGIVDRHSKNKAEVYSPPIEHNPIALRYTGESTFSGLRSHAHN